MTEPYDFGQARLAAQSASLAQKGAEEFVREAAKDYADAERAYRVALAQEIVRQHAQGVAWSTAPDLARGEKHVADLRVARDVSEGVRASAEHAVWRRVNDRKDTQSFIEWSRMREFAEARGATPIPDGPIFGGVRS